MFVAISLDWDLAEQETTVNSVFGPFSDEEKAKHWITEYRVQVEGAVSGVGFDPDHMPDWSIQEVTFVDEDGDLAADMADEGGPVQTVERDGVFDDYTGPDREQEIIESEQDRQNRRQLFADRG